MSLSILRITLDGQPSGVVTDRKTPVLYLQTQGLPQTFRVQVSSGEALLLDSGVCVYTSPFLSLTLPLKPKTCYTASVTVWQGDETDTAQFSFETGFLEQDWAAHWIEPEQENAIAEKPIHFYEIFQPWPEPEDDGVRLRPGQLLRRRFCLEALPKRARLYATAHGVYRLRLNGQEVSDVRLAPGITPYPHFFHYQTYDLRPFLREGENELLVELCDGWWIGRIGLSGDSCQYGNRLGFLAQLELDGEILPTDARWESRPSYIRYSDLYIGEKWDLTHPAAAWRPCLVGNAPTERLIAQPTPGVQPVLTLEGRLFRTPKGELIADFGQALAGVVHLEAALSAPAKITLEHSETLDRSGEFFKNILGRNKQQRDVVLADSGTLVFEPRHTYHGFRYVRISGVGEAEIRAVRAVVLATPVQTEGTFSCSDERLNHLQENICRSIRGNMVSIPTDCPQREKMGWTGDLQIFTKTGCFNAALLPFLSAWLEGLRAEQGENGEIPLISPNFPRTDAMQRETGGENTSSAWGDACVLVPWYLYQCTGDVRVLEENLSMMERWLAFIESAAAVQPEGFAEMTPAQKARSRYLWRSGHHFGDWMIPSLSATPADISRDSALTGPVVASFFYAITLEAYCGVLTALGAQKDEPEWKHKLAAAEALLENVRRAAGEEYIQPDGTVSGEVQGVYVLALYSGAARGALRQKVAERLAEKIRENGNRLDTGFVSTPYLLDVLCGTGQRELAYRLLLSEEAPSWLYQVKMGATTIWEKWQAIEPDGEVTASSMNHYALGSVGDWIYRHIGGIEAADAGYRRGRFAPDVDGPLTWDRCEKQTAYGLVSCCWEKTPEGLHIELQTPVEAELLLPGRPAKHLAPGSIASPACRQPNLRHRQKNRRGKTKRPPPVGIFRQAAAFRDISEQSIQFCPHFSGLHQRLSGLGLLNGEDFENCRADFAAFAL